MSTRLLLAVAVSFITTVLMGYLAIPLLHKLKFGQVIRDDGPQAHLKKTGTPTMGGLFFMLAILVVMLLFTSGSFRFPVVILVMMLAFGLLGFTDDIISVVKKRSLGLKAYQKLSTLR